MKLTKLNRVTMMFIGLCLLLQGCTGVGYGYKSFLGTRPFNESFAEQRPGVFRVEVLGNGFARHAMLKEHFQKLANKVCPAGIQNMVSDIGGAGRVGTLPGIACQPRCSPDYYSFPVVFGTVECKAGNTK